MMNINKQERTRKIGILGAGYISKYHVEAIKLISDLELVAVCDKDLKKAQKLASNKYYEHCYENLDEMISTEELDCIHVLTPPPAHYENIKKILKSGIDVYVEKPFCISADEAKELISLAERCKLKIGVSHNFLCAEAYQKLLDDKLNNEFGKIDQIDIVWQKSLPQLKTGPFDSWLLNDPKNILYEVFPHSFAHAIHLSGELDNIEVDYSDPVYLQGNRIFYRRWEIRGKHKDVNIRILNLFKDAFDQHYIDIHGSSAAAHLDLYNNTYSFYGHHHVQLDIDRYLKVKHVGKALKSQALKNISKFILSKINHNMPSGIFSESIFNTIRLYYKNNSKEIDERLSPHLVLKVAELTENISKKININQFEDKSDTLLETQTRSVPNESRSNILVTGGTGFIGTQLVKRLRSAGHNVRVLSRSRTKQKDYFEGIGVEIFQGDILDSVSIKRALDGIDFVFHLAKGQGPTWKEYKETDFEPTKNLAEACLDKDIQLIYTSSIDVHALWKKNQKVKDNAAPYKGRARTNNYARSKSESEWFLNRLYKKKGLKVVIVRPGIVLGPNTSPLHPGIGTFPYGTALCSMIGDGNRYLPIILVKDCVDAMAKVLEVQLNGKSLSGKSFNLVGDTYLTANEYLDELEKITGVKVKRIYKPPFKGYFEEVIKWMIKKVGHNKSAHIPSFSSIKGRGYFSSYDNSLVKKELSWSPEESQKKIIKEGIEMPARHFLQ